MSITSSPTTFRIDACRRAAGAVDAEALGARLSALAGIGCTPAGGVDRQALTDGDARAHRLLIDWGRALGLEASHDAAGNLFLRRAGLEDGPCVMTGSHLDTQPDGGRFDGAYGVVAGLAALEALERIGMRTRHPVELVVWNNEEGCRFTPGAMGSAVFSGRLELGSVRGNRDRDGVTLGDALDSYLAAFPDVPFRAIDGGAGAGAFVEAHIEQGPLLEKAGRPIGVVTGIQGVRWYEVTSTGRANHAGTTPRSARQDALQAAMALIGRLDDACRDDADVVRFTVGRIEAHPGSINTIPGRASFTIDLRHPDEGELDRLERLIREACDAAAPGPATLRRLSAIPPTLFPSRLTGMVEAHAARLGLPSLPLVSGAFHDALNVASVCPTTMIFVPCRDGISHHPDESADPADLAAGAAVLTAVIAELAEPVPEARVTAKRSGCGAP